MGSGVSSPDDGLLPGQRRWCGGCQGRARLCGATDEAWRWEKWGKGQGEREKNKEREEKEINKERGLESKTKGGKIKLHPKVMEIEKRGQT